MIVRDFSTCPRCGAPTVQSIAIDGSISEYWRECSVCNTYINTYVPQAHQRLFHLDPHRYKANFGGYGSGKTTNSREEFYKHLFITPLGNTLIGANIAPQYEQTIKRDIEKDLPKAFVQSEQKQKSYIDFINGHRLMFRPLDDQGKLRSLNLSMFIIVEGSEVDGDIYSQLKTRLRNMSAATQAQINGVPQFERTKDNTLIPQYANDWRCGMVESNPDSGWIRTQILEVSSDIYKHGGVTDQIIVDPNTQDPHISSHITATDANKYLPVDFYEVNAKNKPAWWVARYLKGSFSYSEGLVYPSAMNCVVPSFPVDPSWKKIIAFDYGLSDNAVFLYGAIDPKGILYIYKEVVTANRNIDELAQIYFYHSQDIGYGTLLSQLIDPKSAPKRDYNKRSLADHFGDKGIYFKPGAINVDARVFRTNTYLESGKLKIMNNCPILIKELRDYKFPEKRLGVDTKGQDKPVDKNNHCINPLEWICMDLPADPGRLLQGAYNRFGEDITKEQAPRYENEYINHVLDLQDEYEDDSFGMSSFNY